jgi:hypothetical protein
VSTTPQDSEVERAQRELRRGIENPDGFFALRGITLSCWHDGDTWWAAIGEQARQYGRGETERDAKVRAVRRWMTEEEGPDLQRRPGQPLP